jgi:hypothetical protein
VEIKTNLNSKRWGSESSRTDGVADTRVYKKVAMAFNKIKPNLFVTAMDVYEMVGDDQDVVGSSHNPRMCPYWAPLNTQPIGPKSGDATPWAEKISIVNQRLCPARSRYGHESRSI